MKKYYSDSVFVKKQKNWFLKSQILFFLFFNCFFMPFALAENQSDLHLMIDKISGSTDDIFTLNISLEKNSDKNYSSLENLELLGLENFQIRGQSSSTNVQILNGKMTSFAEKNIQLQAIKEGAFTLGPITIKSDSGEIMASESVQLTIVKSLMQKTKESLLEPLKKEEEEKKIELKDDLTNKFANKQLLKQSVSNSQWDAKEIKPFDSEKIKMEDFTNWYFWGQLFGGFFLFLIGIFVGGRFMKR